MQKAVALMLLVAAGSTQGLLGQEADWTFVDDTRGGREIDVEFRFPDGLDAPAPLVVVGHGFAMQAGDYEDLAAGLVEEGYVVGLVATESGFAPSHADFGLDMAFVAAHAWVEVPVVPIASNAAVLGHSMGGGAAWLAAASWGAMVATVIGLAPAETNPSAIAAASGVQVPVLVISGSADAVTPPADHHVPIYDASDESPCRAFITLVDGGHCGFADAGTVCDFGELFFNGMDRPTQQAHTAELLKHWLAAHLLGDPTAWTSLEAYADAEGEVDWVSDCFTSDATSVGHRQAATFWPNPARESIQFHAEVIAAVATDVTGRTFEIPASGSAMDVSHLTPGIYWVVAQTSDGEVSGRLLIQ